MGQYLCLNIDFMLIYIGLKVLVINKIMSEKMLKFINIGKETPNKRGVNSRVDDFKEIYDLLNTHGISEQVEDEDELSKKIVKNFETPKEIDKQNLNWLETHGEKILKQTIKELHVFIN